MAAEVQKLSQLLESLSSIDDADFDSVFRDDACSQGVQHFRSMQASKFELEEWKQFFIWGTRFAFPAYFRHNEEGLKDLFNAKFGPPADWTSVSLPKHLTAMAKIISAHISTLTPVFPEKKSDERRTFEILRDDLTNLTRDIFSLLLARSFQFRDRQQEKDDIEDLRTQNELMNTEGTIWNAVSSPAKWNIAKPYVVVAMKLMKWEHPNYGTDPSPFRGVFGDTPLHIALLLNDPDSQFEFFKDLWNLYPDIVRTAKYTHPLYNGENALHLAIMTNAKIELIKHLLSADDVKATLLSGRADGRFFKDSAQTEYLFRSDGSRNVLGECPMVLGEYPLNFAACQASFEVFKELLNNGANVNAKTSEGNNLLHLIVINAVQGANTQPRPSLSHGTKQNAESELDIEEIYKRFLMRIERHLECQSQAFYEVLFKGENTDHLTPLALAAVKGSFNMFECLLKHHTTVGWEFGGTSLLKLELRHIDVPADDEPKEKDSILEILVEHGRRYIISQGYMDRLIDAKWNLYGRAWYQSDFFWSLLFCILFCVSSLSEIDWWTGVLWSGGLSFLFLFFQFNDFMSAGEVLFPVCYKAAGSGLGACIEFLKLIGWGCLFDSAAFLKLFGWGWLFDSTLKLLGWGWLFDSAVVGDELKQMISAFYGKLKTFRMIAAILWKKLWFDRVFAVLMPFFLTLQCMGHLFRGGCLWLDNKASVLPSTDTPHPFHEILSMNDKLIPLIETVSLIFASLLSIGKVIFLAIGAEECGVFITIVLKILDSDLIQFFIVCMIFIMGFLSVFSAVTNGCYCGFDKIWNSTYVLIGPIVGEHRSESLEQCANVYSDLSSNALLLAYHFFVGVVLVNIFVARLNGTYDEIKKEAIANWKTQRAKILVGIDKKLNRSGRRSNEGTFWYRENNQRYRFDHGIPRGWQRSLHHRHSTACSPDEYEGDCATPSPV